MTSGLEKTASRAAPAKTQHRSSSTERSINIQRIIGFFCSLDSFRPSSRQVLHSISSQSTLSGSKASISAFIASKLRNPLEEVSARALSEATIPVWTRVNERRKKQIGIGLMPQFAFIPFVTRTHLLYDTEIRFRRTLNSSHCMAGRHGLIEKEAV